MKISNFKDLIVWQKSRLLAKKCYEITSKFPSSEKFGITNQIRRASVSVASNIAEGHVKGTKEFIRFINLSAGSLAELETQLLISSDIGFLKNDNNIFNEIEEISKMLNKLKSTLNKKLNPNPQSLTPNH
jgi:four helix bundle protein